MKKLLIFTVFLFLFSTSYSQVFVNGVNINEQKTNYCIISKITVGLPPLSVDYGQDKPNKKAEITDKNGKIIETKNIVSFLNFMEENGWELVTFSPKDPIQVKYTATWVFRKK